MKCNVSGGSRVSPRPHFQISYENEIIWYFIFMGNLGKLRYNQQSEAPHRYTYEPSFLKSWIHPECCPKGTQWGFWFH